MTLALLLILASLVIACFVFGFWPIAMVLLGLWGVGRLITLSNEAAQ